MDKVILNGNKARFYNEGNTQSGSIQYTNSKLLIKGNSSGSGVLISDGKLHLKSGNSTSSIIYINSSSGVTLTEGILNLGVGGYTCSLINSSGSLLVGNSTHIDGNIMVSGSSTFSNVVANSMFVTLLEVSSGGGAGKYYQSIGEDPNAFSIWDGVNETHPIHVNGDSRFILFDSAEGGYNVGIGMSDPQYKLDVNGAIRSSEGFTSSGYLKIAGPSTFSNVVANSMFVTLLEVYSGVSGIGKYFQSIGEDPDAFLITDGANDTNVLSINGESKYILFDTNQAEYYIGIGKSEPQCSLDIAGNLRLENADKSLYMGYDIIGGELGVTDGNCCIAVVNEEGRLNYGSEIYINTSSCKISSYNFNGGFGGFGWAIQRGQNDGKYTAQFDNLWVRGSMNVYELVINQIRSTNGSLWVSDASKATSASYNNTTKQLILQFQTGSLVPFIAGDILRSKRWGLSGSTTQSQWDITTTVSSVNYATGYVTVSAPDTNNQYTVTGSANGTWQQFAEKISIYGSQWVRVGNTGSNLDRRGSIYITSTDLGGPFLDVYDLVTSSVQATGGISGSVRQSKTKVRLGQLSGIVDSNFGGELSGYGLYADNVYLRGTISATAGTFSGKVTANQGTIGGWNIGENRLYSNNITISSITNAERISIDAAYAGFDQPGIYFGYSQGSQAFSLINPDGRGLLWINNALQISSSNFTLSAAGDISASNVILGGTIRADEGYLGGSSGWTITSTKITTSGMQLLGGTTPAIKIGNASAFNTGTGIFMSGSSNTSYLRVGQTTGAGRKYLLWDGTNLSWQTPNFTMSTAGTMTITGSVNATSGNFAGSIAANTGSIGGWTINAGGIYSSHANGTVSITKSGLGSLQLYDSFNHFTYSAANNRFYSLIDDHFSNLTIINQNCTVEKSDDNKQLYITINDHTAGVGVNLFAFTGSTLVKDVNYTIQLSIKNLKFGGTGFGPSAIIRNPCTFWIDGYGAVNPTAYAGTADVFDGFIDNMKLFDSYRDAWSGSMPKQETSFEYVYDEVPRYVLSSVITPVSSPAVVYPVTFTLSNYIIAKPQQYSELSQKGLLIFNSADNYIQLSSQAGNNNFSKLVVDDIKVNNLVANNITTNDPALSHAMILSEIYTQSTGDTLNIQSSQILSAINIYEGYEIVFPIKSFINQYSNDSVLQFAPATDIYSATYWTKSNTNYLDRVQVLLQNMAPITASIGFQFRLLKTN